MIGKLTGKVSFLDDSTVIVDVAGVGYIVNITANTVAKINNYTIHILWIHSQVKEGEITLFGFLDLEEKRWFELLITVQGIGGKVALSILSALTIEMLFNAILSQDANIFKKVSGVGPKLASRIINELKDKKNIKNINQNFINNANTTEEYSIVIDAASALANLGFVKSEAFKIANEIIRDNQNIDLSELIRQSLKKLT